MAEILIGIRIEAPDTEIVDLEAFLKGTKTLDFLRLMAILEAATKLTISKITVTEGTVQVPTKDVIEEVLYPTV